MSQPTAAHPVPLSAALYLRVSTDKQTERFGLDLQRHECTRYAEQKGYSVVKVYTEGDGLHGVSGAKTSRAQTTAILLDLQQRPGLFQVLILYDTSRLARDDHGTFGRLYEEELRQLGVRVEYVLGGYGDDPEGQLLKRVKQDFDVFERQKMAIRNRAGQSARARSGRWPGGYGPLGFDLQDGRLVINEEEAALVRTIFHLYAEQGWVLDRIGQWLYQQGIQGKWARYHTRHQARRSSTWDYSGLYRLVTNSVYIGRAVWGRKKNPRAYMPQDEVEIPCPRIISDELWQKAQARLRANRHHGRRDKRYPYLVSGLLRCQLCGRYLRAQTAKRAALSYYFCVSRPRRGRLSCTSRVRYRVAEVDAAVWAAVAQGLCDPRALDEKITTYLQGESLPAAMEEARLQRVHEEIAAVERQTDDVLQLSALNPLTRERARLLLEKLNTRHHELVQEREELGRHLRPQHPPEQGWHETLQNYRHWLLSTTWTAADVGAQPAGPEEAVMLLNPAHPPEQLRAVLFKLQQRIVREVVEAVELSPEGTGCIRLRGAPAPIPLQIQALPPKWSWRRPYDLPAFPVQSMSEGTGDAPERR